MTNLNELNQEIKAAELVRFDMKENLLALEVKKTKITVDLEAVEAQIESDVLTGEGSELLKNDKARRAAVKAALLADYDVKKFTERLEEVVNDIKSLELSLRKNQIEIEFLQRSFQIEILVAGGKI